MKKIFSFLAVALFALGFTACEDVPAPYGIEDEISGDGSKTLPFVQSFENSLGAFKSYTLSGEGRWINDHKAAVASGYNSADQSTTAGSYILVSPELSSVNVDSAHLVMDYVLNFFKTAENQKIWITNAFDENQPGAGWTEVPATLESSSGWEDIKHLDVNLPSEFMGGKFRLAFYYITPATKGSTWQIQNMLVLEGSAEGGEDKPQPEAGVKELPYSEPFAAGMGSFTNITTSGAGSWEFDNRGFAKASGFAGKDQPATQGTYYMVSPEIALAGQTEAHLSYEYINSFNDNPLNHQFMINAAFDASKPAEGWVALKADHDKTISWTDWKKADIQIPAEYMGKNVRVAFRYECSTPKASTFEVKNFKAEAGKAGGNTPDVKPEGDAIFSAAMTNGLDGMVNYLGTSEWTWGFDSNYHCAKVSGHVGGKEGHKVAGVAYLVTPEISLANVAEAHVTYESAIGYMSAPENHQMMINANFNESAPEEGWVVLQNKHDEGEKFFTWMGYDVQIPAEMMGKKVRFGFRYECSAEKASTWELKDLKVLAGKAGQEGGGNEGGNTPDTGDVTASNGDFEAWQNGEPSNWKSACTASKGNLSQNSDAHGGKFSVQLSGNSAQNMRLAYKEMEFKAGTYTMTFYTKAVVNGASVRPGIVPVNNGKVGAYIYGEYVNELTTSEWRKVEQTIEVASDGIYCLVIMNSKNPGKDVLIDDFTFTDAQGNAIIK